MEKEVAKLVHSYNSALEMEQLFDAPGSFRRLWRPLPPRPGLDDPSWKSKFKSREHLVDGRFHMVLGLGMCALVPLFASRSISAKLGLNPWGALFFSSLGANYLWSAWEDSKHARFWKGVARIERQERAFQARLA